MEVTVEMQVYIFTRHQLSLATTSCSPLHSKYWTKRGLSKTRDRSVSKPS